MLTIGHNIKWGNFDIITTRKTDCHCKIKKTLLVQELKTAMNSNMASEKLLLYLVTINRCHFFLFMVNQISFQFSLFLLEDHVLKLMVTFGNVCRIANKTSSHKMHFKMFISTTVSVFSF